MLISESKLLQLTEKVVNRYVNKGVIPKRERDDTQMFIVEKFLQKHAKIQDSFSGKSNITTYCISVLNNMCCEVIRKELKHWKNELDEIPENLNFSEIDTQKITILHDEIKYLEKILLLFDTEKSKVNIALCYYYQLVINLKDLNHYFNVFNKKNINRLISGNNDLSKGEIFNNLTNFINLVENKNLKSDAVRMWLTKTITIIINRLNGPFKRANYDKESFQILFELYHSKRNKEA